MNSNAILATEAPSAMAVAQPNPNLTSERTHDAANHPADVPKEDQHWNAVIARDPGYDGQFVFGVSSTGVYCRPSCPARRPRRENVKFFLLPEQAERAGYRACLRCKPKSASRHPQSDAIKQICRYIEQHLDEPITLNRLGKEFNRVHSTCSGASRRRWESRRANTPTLAGCVF